MKEIEDFLNKASNILRNDRRILALCATGSMMTKHIDRYSDVDLVIITNTHIAHSQDEMLKIAAALGSLTAGFTGEHLGLKNLLICLYENPILHVDLKFFHIEEFARRIENPLIIWEKDNVVTSIYEKTTPEWPHPDFQWIEDRFWVWIHYMAARLGRGEFFEVIGFLSFLRKTVIGPFYHVKYHSLSHGVRKMEFILSTDDLHKLKATIPEYTFESIKTSIYHMIEQYRELREMLFDRFIIRRKKAEKTSVFYLDGIKEAAH